MVIADPCSILNAVSDGANTVSACIECRSPVKPAVLMSVARVASSGLCDAAVTTLSIDMACRLPMPEAGIIPQSEPNAADSCIGECEAIGWCVCFVPDAELAGDVELLQAAAVRLIAAATAPMTAAVPRLVGFA